MDEEVLNSIQLLTNRMHCNVYACIEVQRIFFVALFKQFNLPDRLTLADLFYLKIDPNYWLQQCNKSCLVRSSLLIQT